MIDPSRATAGPERGPAPPDAEPDRRAMHPVRLSIAFVALAGIPGGAVAQGSDTSVSAARADSVRMTFERPAAKPPADALDVIGFPFRVVLFPVGLAAQTAGALVGVATRPDPSIPAATIFAARRWGLDARLGSLGPRSGLALELELARYRPWFVQTGLSIRRSQRHRAGIAVGDSSATGFVADYQWRRDAADQFWGVGPGSAEDARSDFLRDKQQLGARGWLRLGAARIGVGLAIEDNRVGSGLDDMRPDVQQTFAADSLFGIDGRPRFVRVEATGALDFTHRDGFQHHGVRVSGGLSLFRGVDGTDSDFHRVHGEVLAYAPVNPAQSLALRARLEANGLDSGSGIPFFDLSRLGGSRNGPRGFPDGRFRDRASLSVMAEWRYEIWEDVGGGNRAEGFLFLDSGGVAPDLGSLRPADLRESYGLGLRLINRDTGLLGLAYLGFGSEGVVANLKTGWAF